MTVEVVREYRTEDGLGAMLWKKIYAMSYARAHNKLFQDVPWDWFLIHPSDRVDDEEDPMYEELLHKFNNVLLNPWRDVDFSSLRDAVLCPHVGEGASERGGWADEPNDYCLRLAPNFNKFDGVHNSVVIHIRRGNVVPENPRWIPDTFYVEVLKNLSATTEQLGLHNPRVVVLTDSSSRRYRPSPLSARQVKMWGQPYLHADNDGFYPQTVADFSQLRRVCPELWIMDSLPTYEAFELMVTAAVLVPGNSSFSQAAALLSKNKVVTIPTSMQSSGSYNSFAGTVGRFDEQGKLCLF